MDEKTLIERAAKGDGQAFSELMAAQEGRMYAVALRMCGHREDAQDCLQEAMLRVYRSISSFKGQSSFSTWVYRITMNTCLDELQMCIRDRLYSERPLEYRPCVFAAAGGHLIGKTRRKQQ